MSIPRYVKNFHSLLHSRIFCKACYIFFSFLCLLSFDVANVKMVDKLDCSWTFVIVSAVKLHQDLDYLSSSDLLSFFR